MDRCGKAPSRCWMLLLAACIGLSSCSRGAAPTPPRPLTPVRLGAVQTLSTGNPIKYSASIVPNAQLDLSFRSSGYIESIKQVRGVDGRLRDIGLGDWVAKGTKLAIVRPDDYLAKLNQAKAQLASAQANDRHAKLQFQRTAILYSEQSATKPEYDQANAAFQSAAAAVKAARASVAEAQIALQYCYLKAPFGGWILQRDVEIGSLVGPGSKAFTLADTRFVKAIFGVPDFAISQVRLGQAEMVTTDALAKQFRGRVTAISSAADPKSRVYSVEVSVANPRNELKAGMISSIELNGQQPQHPVMAIPLSAVVRDPNQPEGFAVLVAKGAGDTVTLQARAIQIGAAYGNLVEIKGGVTPGERVVKTGATMVRSGERVRVIP